MCHNSRTLTFHPLTHVNYLLILFYFLTKLEIAVAVSRSPLLDTITPSSKQGKKSIHVRTLACRTRQYVCGE